MVTIIHDVYFVETGILIVTIQNVFESTKSNVLILTYKVAASRVY